MASGSGPARSQVTEVPDNPEKSRHELVENGKVVPMCWFVAEFLEEHPEYAGLRA